MKVSLFVITLLLVFQGCEFPLDDENFVEISDEPKNKIAIALQDLPDTVEVFSGFNISYSLDVEGFPAIAIFAVVGDQAQYLGYNYSGMFWLSNVTDQITTKGYLPFEFVVLTTSRTGSLADRNQRELVLFSEKRVLYFDYTPVKPINFTKVEKKDGSLFLHWDKYPERNLAGFLLQKTLPKNGQLKTEYIELDKNATSYHDDAYVGTEVEYVLKTTNGRSIEASGEPLNMNLPPSKILTFDAVGPNQVKLKWKRPHYYNNAIGYQLTQNLSWGNPFYSNSSSSDTTYVLNNLPLGDELKLFLTTKSNIPSNNTIEETTVWLGKKRPAFNTVEYNKNDGSFLFLTSSHLIREKNGVRDSAYFNLIDRGPSYISPDGQSIYVSTVTGITKVSTASLTPQQSYGVVESYSSFLPHGNNIITVHNLPFDPPVIKVYDKSSGATLQTFPLTDIPGGTTSNKSATRLSGTPLNNYVLTDGAGDIGLLKLASDGTVESAKFATGRAAVMSADGNHVYVFGNYRTTYTFPAFEKVDGSEIPCEIHPSGYIYDTGKRLIAMPNNWDRIIIADMETLTPLINITTRLGSYSLKNGVLFVSFLEGNSYAYDAGL
ncbi:MAG TPA: hypothetical protein VF141_10165 [Chryseolinea sp.]